MRAILFLIVLSWAGAGGAAEPEKLKFATVNEIRQQLPGAQGLNESRDGFEYRANDNMGYQISNGRVCVRYPNAQVDCVKVLSNGKHLQIIDSEGSREWLK